MGCIAIANKRSDFASDGVFVVPDPPVCGTEKHLAGRSFTAAQRHTGDHDDALAVLVVDDVAMSDMVGVVALPPIEIVELVVVRTMEDVITNAAHQHILAGTPEQRVVARMSEQQVVAAATVQYIVAGSTDRDVVRTCLVGPGHRRGAGLDMPSVALQQLLESGARVEDAVLPRRWCGRGPDDRGRGRQGSTVAVEVFDDRICEQLAAL